MANLTALWRLVETRPSRTAVMVEWQKVAGASLPAVRPLLRPLDAFATAYPNPRPHGQPMKVVRHADGTIVAIDEQDWQHRLNLKHEDIVLHQLDLRELRKMLCAALSAVNIAKTPVPAVCACVQIGNWEPKKAANFPVYLLLCQHRGRLREELLDLMATCQRPGAILLTPTRANWSSELQDMAHSKNMLLVPLSEVINAVDGAFRETAAWEEYLQAFAQMVKVTLPGNYRNKKPVPRRAELAVKVEKLTDAIVQHIYAARDGVVASMDAGRGATLPFILTKSRWAKLAGLESYHVTRCLRCDPQLRELYRIANDPDAALNYGRRRRRS